MSFEKKKECIFIADYFYEQGVHGGAETCNKNLIESLEEVYGWKIQKINSSQIDISFIKNNKDKIFVIANFMFLKENARTYLSSTEDIKYIIYEHDHKYVTTNDPSKFPDMIIPPKYIINREFYEKAKCVLAQSKLHAEIIEKNLLLKNIINLSGNVWSGQQIALLGEKLKKHNEKWSDTYSILYSQNQNKGMMEAIDVCKKRGWKYNTIPASNYEDFLDNINKSNKIIFIPQWVETFSRVCVEAKILGCKVITNNLVGCFSEDWVVNNVGNDLLNELRAHSENIVTVFDKILQLEIKDSFFYKTRIENENKISVITSMYKGKRYLTKFLSNIERQTYCKEGEFIFAHAKSETQDEEEQQILDFINKNKHINIKYFKLDTLPTVQESMNFMIENAENDIISIWNIDDDRKQDSLEKLSSFFNLNQSVEIVYHDCYQTETENESFEYNSSSGLLYEHSTYDFSSENMIKCIPGPMPSWRKNIHRKVGNFDTTLKYAGDWDFWLRCVRSGCRFAKIGPIMGLYYFNPSGLSTSSDLNTKNERLLEERMIFIKNIDIFGEACYRKYRGYFNVE